MDDLSLNPKSEVDHDRDADKTKTLTFTKKEAYTLDKPAREPRPTSDSVLNYKPIKPYVCIDTPDKNEGGITFVLTIQMGLEVQARHEFFNLLETTISTCSENDVLLQCKNASASDDAWPVLSFLRVRLPVEATEEAAAAFVQRILFQMRSIHDVLRYHLHLPLPECEDPTAVPEALYQELKRRCTENPKLVSTMVGTKTFRVTTSRCGEHHSFTSQNIEFEAGGALQETYGAVPKMKNSEVNVRVDVVGTMVVVGTQLNEVELSRRHKTEYLNRVTIKTNIAFIMLQLAGFKKGQKVLDPFCGSGTILLEAAEISQGDVEGFGCDSVSRTIDGAAAHAKKVGYEKQLKFKVADVVGLSTHFEREQFDCVVTNPPWGVQVGVNINLRKLYQKFLSGAWTTSKPGAKVVVFVLQAIMFLEIVREFGQFEVESLTVVKTRNNLPTIFVLKRLPNDHLYTSLKEQLYCLGNFVNMPTALFNKLHDKRKNHD
eukprot:m.149756 g.149756  ORF g.149756 m.149756 type:complete len:488 (+) comp30681_c0_seq2:1613-3076(+)